MPQETLKKLMLFEFLNQEQLEWVAEHSSEVSFQPNERIFKQGDEGIALWVLIEGQWKLVRTTEGVQSTVVDTAQPGTWVGGIPLPRGQYQNDAYAVKSSRLLRIFSEDLEYMLTAGFPIAHHLIAGLTVGARNIEKQDSQREKMAALGKLSAGLAHELNNPAAAGKRAAVELRGIMEENQTGLLKLAHSLSPSQLDQLAALQQQATAQAKNAPQLSTLDQNEREEELTLWLDDREIKDSWKISPVLVEAGLDVKWLDTLAQQMDEDKLEDALNWITASLNAHSLLYELEQSNERISVLVKAIKEYSYMDQAPVQEIDIHDGLENTLTILNHKLKHGITVLREYDRNLPHICAHGSELNQVWTNILDNAIDAMEGKGQIRIRTWQDNNCVAVEIGDNGPGIPPEIQSRIFEPFFTTKGVGKGTGLGLDTSYRIVTVQHKGEIKLISQPGDTRFQVRLPISK